MKNADFNIMRETINKVFNEDCLEGLKKLPCKSIDCCITSPPFYGLRDYGLEDKIWRGSRDCKHKWIDSFIKNNNASGGSQDGSDKGFHNKGQEVTDSNDRIIKSNVCIKCKAWKGSLGFEPTPEMYIEHLVEIFQEVKRVLKNEGNLWLNIGDSYCGTGNKNMEGDFDPKYLKGRTIKKYVTNKVKGIKSKDLIGIPWMLAFALRNDGWYLRSDIIWHKPNTMPESVKDRPTKSYEHIFLLSKNKNYYYDADSMRQRHWTIQELYTRKILNNKGKYREDLSRSREEYYNVNGKNERDVWILPTKPCKNKHYASYPIDLVEKCLLAGCPENGIILDPFMGSGTTAVAAVLNERNFIGFELSKEYCKITYDRIREIQPRLFQAV